jgi:hypothetical protein
MDFDKGKVKTLFHGLNGSRVVPQFSWMRADIKQGRDGSDSKWYTTGWHILETLDQAKEYLQRFKGKDSKCIVEVETRGPLWRKVHSPAEGLWLAEDIKITGIVWLGRDIINSIFARPNREEI